MPIVKKNARHSTNLIMKYQGKFASKIQTIYLRYIKELDKIISSELVEWNKLTKCTYYGNINIHWKHIQLSRMQNPLKTTKRKMEWKTRSGTNRYQSKPWVYNNRVSCHVQWSGKIKNKDIFLKQLLTSIEGEKPKMKYNTNSILNRNGLNMDDYVKKNNQTKPPGTSNLKWVMNQKKRGGVLMQEEYIQMGKRDNMLDLVGRIL